MQKIICSWEDQSSVESSSLVSLFCWGVWLLTLGLKQSWVWSVSSVLFCDSHPSTVCAVVGAGGIPGAFVQYDITWVAPSLPAEGKLNCLSRCARGRDSSFQEFICSAASEPAPHTPLSQPLLVPSGAPSHGALPWLWQRTPSIGPGAGTSCSTMQPVHVLSRTRAVCNLLYDSSWNIFCY